MVNKKIELTKEMEIIFNALESRGFQCYMVGGCVRDFLIGKKPNDIDFTTDAFPEDIKKCFKVFSIFETGIMHGTVSVVINHQPFEITTFRRDGDYLDNRHPESVKFVSDVKEDLARRDFTINAICYNPKVGFVDCFGGFEDLQHKIIRCVGNPETRFKEDSLRILRAIRFSAVLGYEIEENTKNACFNLSSLLKNISVERITSELFKTIVQPNAGKIMLEYVDVFGVAIPELLEMKGFEQHNPHHIHDVLKHTCVALSGADEDLIVRLAVLFHDIGKPKSFSMDKKGNGHFYGHAKLSEEKTRGILNRLKVDNNTKNQVLTLVKYHDLDLQPTEKYVKRLCYKLGSIEMVKKLLLVQRADNFGQAPLHPERLLKFDEIDKIIQKLEGDNLSFSLKDLTVRGEDLMSLGLSGKEIGEGLKFLLSAVLNNEVENEKEPLLNYLKSRFCPTE